MTGQAVMVFDGTPTTVISTTGTIADGNFSVDSTNCTVTQFDNSTDLWPLAVATLSIVDTWAAAPDANSTVDLYMVKDDVDSTSDEDMPTLTVTSGAHYVGSFVVAGSDAAQYRQIVISLAGVRKCRFAIYNGTGQTISYSSGNTVKIEGFSYVPA